MLSSKVIDAFKASDKPNTVQVNKEAHQAVLDKVIEFLSLVLSNCETLAAVSRRKTYKLIDVVNASAQALRNTNVNVGAFLTTVLGAEIDEKQFYSKDDLKSTDGMYEIVDTGKGPQKRVNTLNTLRLARIEAMFATTQKAARDANVFLSRTADFVALTLLAEASRQARAEGKKRIVRMHITGFGNATDSPSVANDDAPPTPPPNLVDNVSDVPEPPTDLVAPPAKQSKKRKRKSSK